MKPLMVVLMTLILVCAAPAQTAQCLQTSFSGEAKRATSFRQSIGNGITFGVYPMQLREDPKQAWFAIRAIADTASVFQFHPSDSNWILAATDFWTAFIGGARPTDLRRALAYRSRHLLIPLSAEAKEQARKAAALVYEAKTQKQEQSAVAALAAVRMAQAKFEIQDFLLGGGVPPSSVEWVRFSVSLTVPRDFALSAELPAVMVDCPALPAEVFADLRTSRSHKYLLPATGQSRREQN